MTNNRGNIEILMLLCCLVGVVIFLSFALGVTAIAPSNADLNVMSEDRDSLKTKKQKDEDRLKMLESMLKELQSKIKDIEKKIPKTKDGSIEERRKMERELEALQREYENLKKEIESLQKELARLSASSDPKESLEEMKKRLEDLKAALEKLEQRIKGIKKEIAELSKTASKIDSSKEERDKQKRHLEKLEQEKAKLEKEIEKERVASVWKGASTINNPLFVECKKNLLILYPEKRAVLPSELEKKNVFKEAAARHDGIVLLVRPDGFESFSKSYSKIKNMNLKISYEPIDADWPIEFLERKQP